MRRVIAWTSIALFAVLAAGCIDLDQEFTINPDGSGKVVVQLVYNPLLMLTPSKEADPEVLMKDMVKGLLEGAEGVDSWGDVAYRLTEDGKISVKATAYFRDLSRLNLAGRHASVPLFNTWQFTRAEDGRITMEAIPVESPLLRNTQESSDLTEEQIKKRILMERAQYRQMKSMLEAMFKELRIRTRLNVPGAIETCALYKKEGERTVELSVEGSKVSKVIEEIMADEKHLREEIKKGRDVLEEVMRTPSFLNEKLFGAGGPARVVVREANQALFDYEAEIKVARQQFAKVRSELGMSEKSKEPPTYQERNPQILLQQSVVLDLHHLALKAPLLLEERFRDHLGGCLGQSDIGFIVLTQRGSSTRGSGSSDGLLRLCVEERNVLEFEYRANLGRRILITQDSNRGRLYVLVRDESTNAHALLVHDREGKVRFLIMRGDKMFTASWASFEEAIRRDPVMLSEHLLPLLRSFPLTVPTVAADDEVARECLIWHKGLNEEVLRQVKGFRDQLRVEDPLVRDEACRALEGLVSKNPHALRVIICLLSEEQDAEVKGCFQRVIDSRKDLAEAFMFVDHTNLHRDPRYIAAFMESADSVVAGAAQRRLSELLGHTFSTRAQFDTWYRDHEGKLIWDASAGTYRTKP